MCAPLPADSLDLPLILTTLAHLLFQVLVGLDLRMECGRQAFKLSELITWIGSMLTLLCGVDD